MSVAYVWETFFPHEEFDHTALAFPGLSSIVALVLDNNSVARAQREKVNPYLTSRPSDEPEVYAPRDPGLVAVAERDTLAALTAPGERLTTTAAIDRLNDLQSLNHKLQLVSVGALA